MDVSGSMGIEMENDMIRKPTHPGKVFAEDVLKPLDLSVTDAAETNTMDSTAK